MDDAVVVELLRDAARSILPGPAALVLFGSTARGEARADSDVDVLAVRPFGVAFDDDGWTDAVIAWCEVAQRVTGRCVQVLDASEEEVPELLGRPGPTVWRDIATEGVVLAGAPLPELGARVAPR
jgi:hypothetical protein